MQLPSLFVNHKEIKCPFEDLIQDLKSNKGLLGIEDSLVSNFQPFKGTSTTTITTGMCLLITATYHYRCDQIALYSIRKRHLYWLSPFRIRQIIHFLATHACSIARIPWLPLNKMDFRLFWPPPLTRTTTTLEISYFVICSRPCFEISKSFNDSFQPPF